MEVCYGSESAASLVRPHQGVRLRRRARRASRVSTFNTAISALIHGRHLVDGGQRRGRGVGGQRLAADARRSDGERAGRHRALARLLEGVPPQMGELDRAAEQVDVAQVDRYFISGLQNNAMRLESLSAREHARNRKNMFSPEE